MVWLFVQAISNSVPIRSPVFSTDQIYLWSPPNPVTKFYYRCERIFCLDTLVKLYEAQENYAIVLISGKRCDFYLWNSNYTKRIKTMEESLPNQHTTGGQSAQRFERNRQEKIGWYVKKILETMIQLYVSDGLFKSKGLIIGGPAGLKELVVTTDSFYQFFKPKLLKIITTPEITDCLIHTAIAMSVDVLSDARDDIEAIRRFEQMMENPLIMNRIEFGTTQVENLFNQGHLQEIWISSEDPKVLNKFIRSTQKTKIIIIHTDTFRQKYRDIVGIRYYTTESDEIVEV